MVPRVPKSQTSNSHTQKLCLKCTTRPRYRDPTSGKVHSFCSKSCASAYQKASRSPSPSAGDLLCIKCRKRPKFSDGCITHQFCGKSCAKAAKSAAGSAPSPPVTSDSDSSTPLETCATPGCSRSVYVDTDGKVGKYCSKTHKREAETCCLVCRGTQNTSGSHFCPTCQVDIQAKAPLLLAVSEDHHVFQSVASQFAKSWRSVSVPCPAVRAVYKVVSSQQSLDKYQAYQSKIESQGKFSQVGRSPGNEHRRWHGTKRRCNLGDNGNTSLCSSLTCALCCIIRTSYDLSFFGKKSQTAWGRFGAGIYTSSTSSKSNDYSKNETNSAWKAIVLNKVVVGKGYKVMQNRDNMTGPPPGYDSVLAEVGGTLKYDELIVYNEDAVRPSYVVMYDQP